MKNVTVPRTVSFEDALRGLCSKLTGVPVAELPRTQEAVVQYLSEHLPTLEEFATRVAAQIQSTETENKSSKGRKKQKEERNVD